jgi:hypothetical protein
MVLYRLWERGCYCRAQERFDEIYQAHLRGRTPAEAKRLATQQYVQETLDKQVEGRSKVSSPTYVETTVKTILQRASRWTALVKATNSAEILLIDQSTHITPHNMTLGNVIVNGTDDEFEEMKSFMMSPESLVKEDCLRLSGVSDMIFDLATAKEDSELRGYLAKVIKMRIESVFGPPQEMPGESFEGSIKFFNGRPQCFIMDIFGLLGHFRHDCPLAGATSSYPLGNASTIGKQSNLDGPRECFLKGSR